MTSSNPSDTADADQPESAAGLGGSFWRLWSSDSLSNLADGILKVALPLIALEFTRSPTLIAGLAFAFTLPWLLFALPAGALADRIDRRRAMLGANIARATIVGVIALGAAFGFGSIWMLYIGAFAVGMAETIYDTSAQSILPQVVSRDLLPRANSRLYVAETVTNQFIGPPLGGVLAAVGAGVALATPAGMWLVAVGALLMMRGSFRVERTGRTTIRADIAEGLRFLWRHTVLRSLAIMTGVFNLSSNAAFAVFVLYAVGPTSPMKLTEPQYGLLLTSFAIGSVGGSFLAVPLERRLGRARTIGISMIGPALSVGVPALTSNVWAIGIAFLFGGAAIMIWNVIVVSFRQRATPDHLLGRVNSAYRLVAWGTMPVGAAIGGALAQWLGLTAVFAIMTAVVLSMFLFLFVVTDARMDAAEAHPTD
ncbi:MFS transporter [Diaminobutyricibacter tongyongensis]|uniref:MFS transporter n=1 Tax=Leifsonia tongyongensis TaxID=1268043 RepID=A0A6L9XT29_9MICO|nr:MFS transporter [Diaminobutyricibacter tongyongensis]